MTFLEYHKTCEISFAFFGKDRLIDDLLADDFLTLRVELAKTRGPVAFGNEIQRIRSVFKYAYETGLIEKPMHYGQDFDKPSRKTLRKVRNEKGPRMFEAEQIRSMLAEATNPSAR